MKKRTMDEMIAYFNQEVSKMDISQENKMALLGMITAIGYESKKQEVVRCKDCIYNKGYFTNSLVKCGCGNGAHHEGFFCADGERRDQDDADRT